jgi:hypothetical protein
MRTGIKMAPTKMVASLRVFRKLCCIFLNVLFLTLLAQKILSVITYSREELLDTIGYKSDINLPTLRPGIRLSQGRILCSDHHPGQWIYYYYLIPEADPKQHRRRRGRRSGLLVRLRRCAHSPALPSIPFSSLLTTS